ncbi:MAG: exodeoxyribonuclease I [Cellvibrionaceae bacterium]
MAVSLYWHDYETWGEKPTQDKPSQFAGVRTNEALEIIGEPLSIYCQPPSDSLPKPIACMITGITPQHAMEHGFSDHEFIAKIHRELSRPGTCGVGYNSIRFDDEVTRNGLFRNFYDPYEREWRNGNSRWDIIDMVRLTYALRPEGIEWPRNEDGSPSFRLELLSAANGLIHEAAHDALSDVYATIAMAKLIKEKQPNLYDYAFRMRNKKEVGNLIDLQTKKPLLHISSKYPATQACSALVIPLAMHPTNKNGVIVYDLSADPSMLIDLTADEIHERLFVRQEDLPEDVSRVPLKVVHLNKSPILVTPKLVDGDAEKRMLLDKAKCDEHWKVLRDAALDVSLVEKLHHVFEKSNFEQSSDPEQSLYNGFLNDGDKSTSSEVRKSSAEELKNSTFSFYDQRLSELLFRYRARNFPESLSDEEKAEWEEFRKQKFTDPKLGYTISEFKNDIGGLLNNSETTEKQKNILNDLLAYEQALTKDMNL